MIDDIQFAFSHSYATMYRHSYMIIKRLNGKHFHITCLTVSGTLVLDSRYAEQSNQQSVALHA